MSVLRACAVSPLTTAVISLLTYTSASHNMFCIVVQDGIQASISVADRLIVVKCSRRSMSSRSRGSADLAASRSVNFVLFHYLQSGPYSELSLYTPSGAKTEVCPYAIWCDSSMCSSLWFTMYSSSWSLMALQMVCTYIEEGTTC